MSEQDVISLHNVTVTFDRQMVLDQVNFSLGIGEFCYVIGKTGAGKSSFLKLLYRDIKPDKGIVKVAIMMSPPSPIKRFPIFDVESVLFSRIFSCSPIGMYMITWRLPCE